MTADTARRKIVIYSLLTTTVFAVFIVLCPLFIQIDSPDAYRILQIVFPVFAGYLGTAVIFLFNASRARVTIVDPTMLSYLVHCPFYIFWAIAVAVFIYFYVSNLPGGVEGMKVKELADYMTLVISFMNVTTGALMAFLFGSEQAQTPLIRAGAGGAGQNEAILPPDRGA